MTKILGISALSHDASVSVLHGKDILFASHSERYSKIKNDKFLNDIIIKEALSYGKPDIVAFYEQPWLKKTRQLYAGQYSRVFSLENTISQYLKQFPDLKGSHIEYVPHHLSHAAAGALTSDFDEACVVVIDAIGEWDCVSVWQYRAPCYFEKVYSLKYPNSLGLFYTAMTQRVGLKPNEDEYILMGMAAYGTPKYTRHMDNSFFIKGGLHARENLHKGCDDYLQAANIYDIAASAQSLIEEKINKIMIIAKNLVNSQNLVYMGGTALNCVANNNLFEHFKNVWIMPNPGDSGSSLGAAAYVSGSKINWKTPYLGHDIKGDYPVNRALTSLLNGSIIGIANGHAEFGPRALGNRSLLADPRGPDIKDEMNTIKQRQKFRPFAPVILEEHAKDYFDLIPKSSPYMQYTAICKSPNEFPAIIHKDGTSRVQTVSKNDHCGLYKLLSEFYSKTGCPMLVNTSLNIKGMPMVNDELDAKKFENKYNVKVFTKD